MTIEIDFSFEIDGLIESINYYRSSSPMSPSAMPVPTATGITGTEYTDTTAIQGEGYYVRFGSIRGSGEKISDEIFVYASTGDIHFAFVDLLIISDTTTLLGTSVTDSSQNNRAITKYGNTKIAKAYPNPMFCIAGNSIVSNNTVNGRLSAPFSITGTSNFTIETTVIPNLGSLATASRFFACTGVPVQLLYSPNASATSPTGIVGLYMDINGVNSSHSGVSLSDGVEYHVALMRIASVFYLFLDGNLILTQSSSASLSAGTIYIFNSSSFDRPFPCFFKAFRVTKSARYSTSGFSLSDVNYGENSTDDALFSSVDLLLKASSLAFKDLSTSNKTITKAYQIYVVPNKKLDDGWVVLDGSNDYVTATISALNTSDFTIEAFIFDEGYILSGTFFALGVEGTNGSLGFRRGASASSVGEIMLTLYSASLGSNVAYISKSIVASTMKHLCLMRKNGIFYLFVDGVLQGSDNSNTAYNVTSNVLYIGGFPSSGKNKLAISSFRLTKIARYSEMGFTVPDKKFPISG